MIGLLNLGTEFFLQCWRSIAWWIGFNTYLSSIQHPMAKCIPTSQRTFFYIEYAIEENIDEKMTFNAYFRKWTVQSLFFSKEKLDSIYGTYSGLQRLNFFPMWPTRQKELFTSGLTKLLLRTYLCNSEHCHPMFCIQFLP